MSQRHRTPPVQSPKTALRDYLYVDRRRLDMLTEQIAPTGTPVSENKKSVSLSISGPKTEIVQESKLRARTTHEKIVLLENYLREHTLLASRRPLSMVDGKPNVQQPYVLETMDAQKIILPLKDLEVIPGLTQLAIWISDPDPNEYVSEPWVWNGTFVYLVESVWDNGPDSVVFSGVSALQAIVNASEGRSLFEAPRVPGEPFGRDDASHPLQKLARIGGIRTDVRRITALYRQRYFIDEQCYTYNGEERRVNDLLAYPVYISAA